MLLLLNNIDVVSCPLFRGIIFFFFNLKHSTCDKMWFSLSNCHWVLFLHAKCIFWIIFSSVQSLSHVRLFATPCITARQASLSITNSQRSLRLTSIESVVPSSHFILCRPLLLLPPTPPSIRVFSNESTLHMRWPKYWSFSFS